jgi:acetyl-CoA acetyltransferase
MPFAVSLHQKVAAAQASCKFGTRIMLVGTVSQYDGVCPQMTMEIVLKNLQPVFKKKNDITTLGNSSQTTDGATAILLS